MTGTGFVLMLLVNFPVVNSQIWCDRDSDCFYVPEPVRQARTRVPALLVLHCNRATAADLDSFKNIGDSLGWVVATCHNSRNHQDIFRNDSAIVKTIDKLLRDCPADSGRIFLFGFSGQGIQALATMFLHPELVRGVVTVCAHTGALPLAEPERLTGNYVYLVTREKDWNRIANYQLNQSLNLWGVRCTLRVTPGEHGPGPWSEVLTGCRWLQRQTASAPPRSNPVK
jgi:predicted esterase